MEGPDVANLSYRYSPKGLVTRIAEDDGAHETFFFYDERGQLSSLSDGDGAQASFSIAANGQLESYTDSNGVQRNYEFNSAGLSTRQENGVGGVQTVTDNLDGSFTIVEPTGLETNMVLDAFGNTTSMTFAGDRAVTIGYDESSNISSVSDPLDNLVELEYSALEQPNEVSLNSQTLLEVEYDGDGFVTQVTNARGQRRTFEYDSRGNLTTETWLDDDDTAIRTIEIDYQTRGIPRTVTDTDSEGTHLHTFGLSLSTLLPSSLTSRYAGQESFDVLYSWEQQTRPVYQPTNVTVRGNGLTLYRSTATYRANKNSGLVWNAGGARVGFIDFLRNPDGSIRTISRSSGSPLLSSPHSQTQFAYTAAGPLASIRHEAPDGSLLHPDAEITYQRDVGNRITSITQAGNMATVSYDTNGFLAGVSNSRADYSNESFTYDAGGNRISSHLFSGVATIQSGNQITAAGEFTYEYDADGNLTQKTNTSTGEFSTYQYDHRNQLSNVSVFPGAGQAASSVLRFKYDFLGHLICREINGEKTWILYDRDMPVAEFRDEATELSRSYFYALNRIDDFFGSYNHETQTAEWFLKDNIGSVRGILDFDGELQSWVDYDSHGNILGTVADELNPVRYAGRYYCDEIDLYENRMRFYDPLLGRFTQHDPLLFGGGDTNFYAFVGNNPLQWVDPFGTTIAAEYGNLISTQASAQINAICALGECVANIWAGNVVAVVTLTAREPNTAIETCAKSALNAIGTPIDLQSAVTRTCGAAIGVLDERLAPPTAISRGISAAAAVDGCQGVTVTIMETHNGDYNGPPDNLSGCTGAGMSVPN